MLSAPNITAPVFVSVPNHTQNAMSERERGEKKWESEVMEAATGHTHTLSSYYYL